MENKEGKILIAHRLRGFGAVENTIDAFIGAVRSEVPLIEVDIRFSKDGVPFLQHDVRTHKADKNFLFAHRNASYIEERVYRKTKTSITKLEEVLVYFAEHKKENQKVSIDVKTFGHEEQLIDLIEQYDLFDHITLFTWTPHIVFAFHRELIKREKMIPMFFSYLRSDAHLGRLYSRLFFNKKNPKKLKKIFRFLFLNRDNYMQDLGIYKSGYTHTFFDRRGLPHDLVNVLRESEGGVCINASFRMSEFLWAKDQGLRTVVFGALFGVRKIKNPKKFNLNEYVDYIFLDATKGFNKFLK